MGKISEDLRIYTEGNPENQAIIFIHGFPYDSSMWEQQIEALKQTHYCISYDIRGLGKSAVGNGQFTMETFADDVFAIIDDYKLERPVICGLSMGGYLSFRLLERDQNKFKAAIFCDTKPVADNNAGKLKRCASIKKIETEGVEKFVKDFIPTCFSLGFMKREAVKFNYIIEKAALASPLGVKGAQLAMLSRTDSVHFLPEIKIPVLVLSGEFDKMTSPEDMRAIADQIPGAAFKVIPDAGHMTPIENPDAFNKAIISFLQKI